MKTNLNVHVVDVAKALLQRYKAYVVKYEQYTANTDYMFDTFYYECDEYMASAMQQIHTIFSSNPSIAMWEQCQHQLMQYQTIVNQLANGLLCAIHQLFITTPSLLLVDDPLPNTINGITRVRDSLLNILGKQMDCSNRFIDDPSSDFVAVKRKLLAQFDRLNYDGKKREDFCKEATVIFNVHLESFRTVSFSKTTFRLPKKYQYIVPLCALLQIYQEMQPSDCDQIEHDIAAAKIDVQKIVGASSYFFHSEEQRLKEVLKLNGDLGSEKARKVSALTADGTAKLRAKVSSWADIVSNYRNKHTVKSVFMEQCKAFRTTQRTSVTEIFDPIRSELGNA